EHRRQLGGAARLEGDDAEPAERALLFRRHAPPLRSAAHAGNRARLPRVAAVEYSRAGAMFDLTFTPAEEAFRTELRAWLAAQLTPDATRPIDGEEERRPAQRTWQRELAAGGWVGIQWPREFGGRDATLKEQIIYTEELARARAPEMLDPISVNIVGPTLI